MNTGIMAVDYHLVMHFVKNKRIYSFRRSVPADAILLQGVKSVVAGSGFTVEAADLLVSLFGVRELG